MLLSPGAGAQWQRPKDDVDFAATLPHLDERRRGWLRATLERTVLGHAWLRRV